MKKLKFNSTLNHKQNEYRPCEISVERVVELGNNYFESLIKNVLKDDTLISKHKELMYIEGNTAHCVLFVNNETGDGLLVESEGFDYPRKSQFIPNAKALIESNEQTQAEKNLHSSISEIADKMAELAHCGEKHFTLEDIEKDIEIDFKSIMRDAVTEMLRSREDIQMAEKSYAALMPCTRYRDSLHGVKTGRKTLRRKAYGRRRLTKNGQQPHKHR